MTEKELKREWPDDEYFKTAAGKKSGLVKRQAYCTREVSDRLSAMTVLASIYFILSVVIVGFGFSLVPGYPEVTDPSGTGLRVPHSIWSVSPAIMIFVWTLCFFFDPYYQTRRIVTRSQIFNGFLLIDLLQNITHLVFIVIEFVQGTTGLASNTTTTAGTFFLIFLLVVVAVAIIIDWLIYSLSSNYALLLQECIMAGWRPGLMSSRHEVNQILLDREGKSLSGPSPMVSSDVRVQISSPDSLSMVDSMLRQRKTKVKR